MEKKKKIHKELIERERERKLMEVGEIAKKVSILLRSGFI